jgi:hypothetical protein
MGLILQQQSIFWRPHDVFGNCVSAWCWWCCMRGAFYLCTTCPLQWCHFLVMHSLCADDSATCIVLGKWCTTSGWKWASPCFCYTCCLMGKAFHVMPLVGWLMRRWLACGVSISVTFICRQCGGLAWPHVAVTQYLWCCWYYGTILMLCICVLPFSVYHCSILCCSAVVWDQVTQSTISFSDCSDTFYAFCSATYQLFCRRNGSIWNGKYGVASAVW